MRISRNRDASCPLAELAPGSIATARTRSCIPPGTAGPTVSERRGLARWDESPLTSQLDAERLCMGKCCSFTLRGEIELDSAAAKADQQDGCVGWPQTAVDELPQALFWPARRPLENTPSTPTKDAIAMVSDRVLLIEASREPAPQRRPRPLLGANAIALASNAPGRLPPVRQLAQAFEMAPGAPPAPATLPPGLGSNAPAAADPAPPRNDELYLAGLGDELKAPNPKPLNSERLVHYCHHGQHGAPLSGFPHWTEA